MKKNNNKIITGKSKSVLVELKLQTAHAGTFKAAVRMYPKNDKLPHRQDFAYVKWFEY